MSPEETSRPALPTSRAILATALCILIGAVVFLTPRASNQETAFSGHQAERPDRPGPADHQVEPRAALEPGVEPPETGRAPSRTISIVVCRQEDLIRIPGATVSVFHQGERTPLGETDAEGILRLDAVDLPDRTSPILATRDAVRGHPAYAGTAPLLSPLPTDEVAVLVSSTATVSGTVVVDDLGTPLQGRGQARVAARRITQVHRPMVQSAEIGPDGQFILTGLERDHRFLLTVEGAAVILPYDGGGGFLSTTTPRQDVVLRVFPILAGLIRLHDPLAPDGVASLVTRAQEFEVTPIDPAQRRTWQPIGKADFSRGGSLGPDWAQSMIDARHLPILGRFVDGESGPILLRVALPGYEEFERLLPLTPFSTDAPPEGIDVALVRSSSGFGSLSIELDSSPLLSSSSRRAGFLTLYSTDRKDEALRFDVVGELRETRLIDPLPAGRYLWSYKLGSTSLEPSTIVGDELPFIEIFPDAVARIEPNYGDDAGSVAFELVDENGRPYGSVFGVALYDPQNVEQVSESGEVLKGRSSILLSWDAAPYVHGGIPPGSYRFSVCSGYASLVPPLDPIPIRAGEVSEVTLTVAVD